MEQIKLAISRFSEDQDSEWDNFVCAESYNGTFTQTRQFLNYHPPGRFQDHSLIIKKGDQWLAVIPACKIDDDGKKIFSSHKGSSFGGVIVHKDYFNSIYLQAMIDVLDEYLRENSFHGVLLKQLPSVFSAGSVDALDYLLVINGYHQEHDLTFVVDVSRLTDGDVLPLLRRNIRQQVTQGIGYGLVVKEFADIESINKFHALLADNLAKHQAKPVHTPAELADLKKRFPAEITFYGCYKENVMIGGAMTWQYNKKVLHLQNIAIDYEYQNLRPGDILNYHLIKSSIAKGVPYFSFGSSTEDHGRRLNFGLSYFKEGFGAVGYLKYNFIKNFG